MAPNPPRPAPRILYLHHRLIGPLAAFPAAFDRARDLGFSHVLVSQPFRPGRNGDVMLPADHEGAHPGLEAGDRVDAVVERLAALARERGLALLLDLNINGFALEHPLVAELPDCFAVRREASDGPVDPRAPSSPQGTALARFGAGCGERLAGFFAERVRGLLRAGAAGFRAIRPGAASAGVWASLVEAARAERPDALLVADTHGLPRSDALALDGLGFDFLLSSLAWWDFRASWFLEEHEQLSPVAPLIAVPEAPFGARLADRVRDPRALRAACERALTVAAGTGCGILIPDGFEVGARRPMDPATSTPADLDSARAEAVADVSDLVRATNALIAQGGDLVGIVGRPGRLRVLTGPAAPVTAILRTEADPRVARAALLCVANPDLGRPQSIEDWRLRPQMGGSFGAFRSLDGANPFAERVATLEPGAALLAIAPRTEPVKPGIRQGKRGAALAAKWPRVVVGNLSPGVDGGAYAVKRTVGDEVTVEADAFTDGHDMIGVELQWRACDEGEWRRTRMTPLGNDRFRASLFLERLGRHDYAVEAWWDRYATYSRDLAKKHDARVDTSVDLMEGRHMLEAARDRSEGRLRERIDAILARLEGTEGPEQVALFLDEETRAVMAETDDRPFRVRSEVQPVEAERTQARFASWYELFPRSQTDDPKRHGTFRDVIGQLPRIRAMGFDVLYFTPIHPIGRKNRKGRNNTLTPGPDDPGSPYAIGAAEGGHDALHPELGTMEDFRALRDAAMAHGLELALDFAIQCSPDHPWLKEHPGWFDYRPDGTIKYAENPPKKYEDIVNVDFYKPDAVPDLWMALRDSVMVWVREGVRTFRVDNPHTKPLPFWQWMITDIRREFPDVIFLSEAFTRPKVMYHLAKVGFSQSYTYFTWRNTKKDLTEYLTELSTTAPKDFFRPHFFVNTPDINPIYLQSSGRAGFLVRACLAATLSGLWGVYSGYELLESDPVPGKEEYKDSEKYEIKVRDWNQPGNITADIARLNRLRKAHPALQTHLGVTFYQAYNDNILYYGKATPGRDDMILVAVNLNPHGAEAAPFEIPLWEWGLPDHGALEVEDLIHDRHWIWHGKTQHMRLDPAEYPFAIWRVRPYGGA